MKYLGICEAGAVLDVAEKVKNSSTSMPTRPHLREDSIIALGSARSRNKCYTEEALIWLKSKIVDGTKDALDELEDDLVVGRMKGYSIRF